MVMKGWGTAGHGSLEHGQGLSNIHDGSTKLLLQTGSMAPRVNLHDPLDQPTTITRSDRGLWQRRSWMKRVEKKEKGRRKGSGVGD